MNKLFISIFLFFITTNGFAQNTASPYSVIGLGDFEKSYNDRTSALGHNGVALTSERFILISNPASLAFLSNPFFQNPFYLDIATSYKTVSYAGNVVKNALDNEANDMQIKKLTFAVKLKPKWGLSFGLLPFTNTNYSLTTQKQIQGTSNTVNADYKGTGSTNQIYISNGLLINKNLSIGLQTSLLFGNVTKKEIIYNNIADSVLQTEERLFISKILFKGGIIYKDTINKDWDYSVGATASLQNKMSVNRNIEVRDGLTVLKSTNEELKKHLALPTTITSGININYKRMYNVVADYTHQNWNNIPQSGLNYTITNYSKFGMGFQYTQKNKPSATSRGGENYYQIGFYNTNGYLNVGGQNIKESAFTFGFGREFSNQKLAAQINIEIGKRGTTNSGLIAENYTQIGLTVSYRDFWNTKKIRRYN